MQPNAKANVTTEKRRDTGRLTVGRKRKNRRLKRPL
jgi:hypothetical protein